MESDETPGFYAPVHRALTEPILLGGAPRSIAIANGTLAAAMALGLRLWILGRINRVQTVCPCSASRMALYVARLSGSFDETIFQRR